MTNKQFNKIERFFKQELTPELKDVTVAAHNGEYELFGKYRIFKNNKGFYVSFEKKNDDVKAEFNSLKNAVAWCTLNSTNQRIEAKNIEKIDRKLSSIDVNIDIHKTLSKSSKLDREARWTQTIKLQDDIKKKKELMKELKTLINSSKRIQLKKFKIRKSNQNSHR